MRGIRRRNARLLGALFAVSAFLFYGAHAGVFLREFAERRLEEFLPPGSRVHIGNVSGGIFGNIVSEDVRVFPAKKAAGFGIRSIEIDYRLWYPLLDKIPFLKRKEGKKKLVLVIGGDRQTDFVTGFLEVSGADGVFGVTGYLALGAKERFLVRGAVRKRGATHLRIAREKGYVDLRAEKKNGIFVIDGEINHVKIQGTDFIGKFSARIEAEDGRSVRAKIAFKDAIVNYRPFGKKIEISLAYNGAKNMLNINSASVGSEIEGHGYLLPAQDYLFLEWTVKNLPLQDYFRGEDFENALSGETNGNVSLKGPVRSPYVSAHFYVRDGTFGDIRFNSVIVNLKGKIPFISVYDSRICTEGGYVTIGGVIDLTGLKDNRAFESVYRGPGDNFFVWNGWNISKENGNTSVRAEKFLDEDIRVSFKAHTEEGTSKEEERFVGVEHRVKF